MPGIAARDRVRRPARGSALHFRPGRTASSARQSALLTDVANAILLILIAVFAAGTIAVIVVLRGPQGGPATTFGVGVLALGLLGFAASAFALSADPTSSELRLVFIGGVCASILVAACGCLLFGVSLWRSSQSGAKLKRRWVGLIGLLAFTGLTTFTGAEAVVGSDSLIHPRPFRDCRSPFDLPYRWTYEAINYDIADDGVLRRTNPDMEHCSNQGSAAGTEVVSADGVSIDGWYIPAASGIGPAGATVVLVHGWADNKSQVLKYAPPLHANFNVVAFDLRNGGRSGVSPTTFGLGERLDVEAIIDWLVRTKHPAHIAVMGNSMGGATAMLAAAGDQRIEAVILDSTHAHIMDVLSRSLEVDRGLPSFPGAPAILAGIWLRTGLDLEDADPTLAVADLGQRPLLLIHGGADVNDVPARSSALIYSAAQAAGVPVELHVCAVATHGTVIDDCPVDWGRWVVDFLDRAFGLPAG